MNIGAIITATVVVAAVGLFIGIFLSIAGKKFAVETDEREVAVREALPGNNCGGCGYPGCDGLAAAIAKGEAPVNACPVGGEAVGKVIAGIMGQEVVESARMAAFVKCTGTCEKTKDNYHLIESKNYSRDTEHIIQKNYKGTKNISNTQENKRFMIAFYKIFEEKVLTGHYR